MQFLIFVIISIASAMADVSYLYPAPSQQLKTPLILIKSGQQQLQQHQLEQQQQQYFTKDTLGQYSYGYSNPLSTKQEVRTIDGITQGTYSYVDPNGLLQTVDYTADDSGFHVTATNLPKDLQEAPKAVMDTPEVAAAREQHLTAYKAIAKGDYSSSGLPKPVEDTAEVAAAKKEFFARYSAEEEIQKLLQKNSLLKSQGFVASAPAISAFTGLKTSPLAATKPSVSLQYLPSLRSPIVPGAGVITYGYQLGGAIKPQRYYLPVA